MNENSNKCAKHKDRSEPAPLCRVCARLGAELAIVGKVVEVALSMGYRLTTDQGSAGDEMFPALGTTDKAEILKELHEVDDERLFRVETQRGRLVRVDLLRLR